MRKHTGYGLWLTEERSYLVKVRTAAERPYHVEWIRPLRAGDHDPAQTTSKKSAVARGRVLQLMSNDDVSLLIANQPQLKPKQQRMALIGSIVQEKGGLPADWILDNIVLPSRTQPGPAPERRDISALFTKRETVMRHYSQACGFGVRPSGFLPGFLALDQLYRRHCDSREVTDGWNLVFLGERERFLCVGDQGCLLFTRSLPEDLSGGTEREEYLDRLTTEIERSSFFAQQAERSLLVNRIVICGEPELSDALTGRLQANSEMEVERWRPENLFEWPDGEPRWQQIVPIAAAAAACHPIVYNLLPDEAKKRVGRAARRSVAVAISTLVTAIVPLLLIGGLWTGSVQQAQLSSAEDSIGLVQMRAEDAAMSYLNHHAIEVRETLIDELQRAQPDLEAVLQDIAVRTPAAVVFKQLDWRRDRDQRFHLMLHGESQARDSVDAQQAFNEFLAAMAVCPRLQQFCDPVYLEITSDEDESRRSRVVFTLEYLVSEDGSQ